MSKGRAVTVVRSVRVEQVKGCKDRAVRVEQV